MPRPSSETRHAEFESGLECHYGEFWCFSSYCYLLWNVLMSGTTYLLISLPFLLEINHENVDARASITALYQY